MARVDAPDRGHAVRPRFVRCAGRWPKHGPKLHIASLRLKRCRCGAAGTGKFSLLSDLFSAHAAPEDPCLEAKRASLVSFEATVGLLKDVLPVGTTLNAETVRNHLHEVASRM